MTAHFDPLDYARQLESAGVPKSQAEVHARTLAHVVNDCVAVPADLVSMKRELTHQISETETRLRAEIGESEARLRAEIAESEARLRAEIAQTGLRLKDEISKLEGALRAEIQAVEARLNIRLSRLEAEIAFLKAEMKFHRWANGLTIALIAGIYLQLLFQ
jgi:hypothetical protein